MYPQYDTILIAKEMNQVCVNSVCFSEGSKRCARRIVNCNLGMKKGCMDSKLAIIHFDSVRRNGNNSDVFTPIIINLPTHTQTIF